MHKHLCAAWLTLASPSDVVRSRVCSWESWLACAALAVGGGPGRSRSRSSNRFRRGRPSSFTPSRSWRTSTWTFWTRSAGCDSCERPFKRCARLRGPCAQSYRVRRSDRKRSAHARRRRRRGSGGRRADGATAGGRPQKPATNTTGCHRTAGVCKHAGMGGSARGGRVVTRGAAAMGPLLLPRRHRCN